MSAPRITDAQVHLWQPDAPEHPWPEGTAGFAHGPEMSATRMLALMDDAGVDRAVLVPPSWSGDSNEVCTAAAVAYPDRFAVAGRVPLSHPLGPDALADLRDRWALKALRFTFSRGASATWMSDGTADWLWGAAERIDIPVFLYAPGLADDVGAVAAAHPGLRLTLDHLMFSTEWRDGELEEPLRRTLELARHPNVSVKASALHSFVTDPVPHRSLRDPLRRVVDAFGPNRVFWGSDVTRDTARYREAVLTALDGFDFLGPDDLAFVMGEAIGAHLGWPT